MHIVFYDTEHFETLATLIRIFDDGTNRITIMVPAAMKRLLEAESGLQPARYEWIPFPPNRYAVARALFAYCKKEAADLLFLNTVTQHHLLFGALAARAGKLRTLLAVHDVRDLFEPAAAAGIRGIVQNSGKRLLRSKVHGFYVLLSAMAQYMQRYPIQQPVLTIPGSLYQNPGKPIDREKGLVVCIPGSIDPTRRDYDSVLEAAALLPPAIPLYMELLGGAASPAGKAVLARAQQGVANGLPLRLHTTGFVPPALYSERLAMADVILVPVPETFQRSSSAEEYGLTKSSGAFFDAVRYGKPLLLPQHVPVPEELAGMCHRYASPRELATILGSEGRETIEAWKKEAAHEAAHFTLENVREKLFRELGIARHRR